MCVDDHLIKSHNDQTLPDHRESFDYFSRKLEKQNRNSQDIVKKLKEFQIAIPSWALGNGGTRFGRFSGGGEPRNLEEKIADVGLLNALNRSSGAISLHIPWDIPADIPAIKALASSYDLSFDAVNSNTFQDQADQAYSYKFGSLCHTDKMVRQQA